MSVTIPVVSTPDVLNGTPRIEGTRVSVQRVGTLVREHGWSRGKVSDEFELTVEEISAAVDYYDTHPEEMDRIAERREKAYEHLSNSSHALEYYGSVG